VTTIRQYARAKTNGIKIARPKLAIEIRQKIGQRAAKVETAYAIAKALGIDRHTAANPHDSVLNPPSRQTASG
jgi:hypothetical protein